MLIKHFNDIGFSVVAEVESHHVSFNCYAHDAWDMDGTPLFHRKGSPCHPDCVNSIDSAEIYLHGCVKWDHCSNWWFDEQDRGVMLHACSREDLINIGELMARCWDWAPEILPTFSQHAQSEG